VILAVGIVVLVRLLRREPSAGGPPAETALDILKKRYARGEIGKEEFEQKKRDIGT
jgi:putative membrane protein